MRIRKLYIKIFLYFLAFLVVVEIAVFGFFALLAGKEFRDRHHGYNNSKITMARQLIEENIKKHPSIPIEENSSLKALVFSMGKVFRAIICLTSPDDDILVKSFRRKIPKRLIKKIREYRQGLAKDDWLHRKIRKHRNLYRSVSLKVGDQTATLHMLFSDRVPRYPGARFALGLLVIGVVLSILIVPVSRQITRPINNLTESAIKIERGDLGARAKVKGADEIGKLGKAFNSMAQKLEKIVKSGKELTAQISHELRTPLARMRLAIELLKDKSPDEAETKSADYLLDMEDDIEELDRLIGRILELSKLDIQETASASELFSPALLLESVLQKFEPLMKSKNITLSSSFNSRLEIFGNRSAFASALSNIVDNARKFSPVNGTVDASVDQKDNHLLISIYNDCPEFSDQDLEKIFEPFYRGAPGQQNGSGLGLAITQKIIEQHSGKISAATARQGLVIKMEIPAAT